MTQDGLSLYVKTRGDGPVPLLFLHGGGVGGWMWQPSTEHVGPNYRLLVPDLPGHDHSAEVPYHSHDKTVEMLASMLIANAAVPAVVVGFSLGGQLAVLLAARHPQLVRDVVVISAQAQPTPLPGLTLAMLRLAAPLAKNDRFARMQAKELFVPEPLLKDYLRTSKKVTTQSLLAAVSENIRFTVPPGWAAFTGRSLILVGEKERRIMRASAERIAATHARSEMVVVDGCGHGIPFQRPEWLMQRLEERLKPS